MLAIASYLIGFDAKTTIFVEPGASFSAREIGFPDGLNIPQSGCVMIMWQIMGHTDHVAYLHDRVAYLRDFLSRHNKNVIMWHICKNVIMWHICVISSAAIAKP